jgi:hypothetical protein
MPEAKPLLMPEERLHRSELFTVRLWREQLNDHWEWRGKVQHVTSGEAHYFRDWETLIARLQDMLNIGEA